jgi:lipoprotein-releasing system permease protein
LSSYEFFIGLRYTRAKQRTRFISFISVMSVVGMALGMMVLITVLSVMNGFQREIRTRILGVASHVQISAGDKVLENWQEVAREAARHDQVLATAPYINAQGLLTYGSAVRGALVRGILPEQEERVAEFGQHMRSGRLEALRANDRHHPRTMARARQAGESAVAPGTGHPGGHPPRLKQFTVVGVNVDHYEFDRLY